MIPKKQNNDDYVDINDEDSVEASIDVNNISHIFDLLSNMYRDNYGSIVREISSNCFDAHRDAGLDDDEPIVISKKYDDTYNSYICFRDFGKGMSPEFMKTTYMSYGKSTKKETNNQLGMYGIGSKSPFSIRDHYFITSYIDGIKYDYIIYKNKNDKGFIIPKYDILSESETKERNGTEIKIPIKGDKYKFEEAIYTQLKYFSNVIYENLEVINNFTITTYNNFKISNFSNTGDKIHICLNNVYYSLNLKELELPNLYLDEYFCDGKKIGLTFNIDELSPTPSREDIIYSTDAINLIKKRLKNALIEIIDLNRDKLQTEEIDNLINYLEHYKNLIKKNVDYLFVIQEYLIENFDIDDSYEKIIKFSSYSNPLLEKSNLNSLNIDCFNYLINAVTSIKTKISKGKSYPNKDYNTPAFYITRQHNVYRINSNTSLSPIKNRFLNECVILQRKTLSKNDLKYIIRHINSSKHFDEFNKQYKKGKINKLKSFIFEYLVKNITSYEDIIVPETFYERDKVKKEYRSLLNDEVKIQLCRINDTKTDSLFVGTLQNFVNKHKGKIIVSTSENEKLMFYLSSYIYYNVEKAYKYNHFCHTSKRNMENLLKNKEKFVSLEEFIQNSKIFKSFINSIYYQKHIELEIPNFTTNSYYSLFKESILEKKIKIKNFIDKRLYSWNRNLSNSDLLHLNDELIKLVEILELGGNKIIDKSIQEDYNELINEINKVPLLKHIGHHANIDDVRNYFKMCKVVMNKKQYKTFDPYSKEELHLINESVQKINYLKSINKITNEYQNETIRDFEVQKCRSKPYSSIDRRSEIAA
jgi:hypothetical protein